MLLTQPVSGLADVYGQLQRTRGSAERIQEFFSVQPEPSSEGKPNLPDATGHIKFEGLSFSYPGRSAVLTDLNLEI